MLTGLALGTIPGIALAVITWFLTRGEREASLHEKLAASAIERMDRAERRIDEMEAEWRTLRQEIYPHRAWDDQAYRKALESDPNYPPPPPLSI